MGAQAGKALLEDKVPLCMTAVYSAHQALTAAALGATYAAPYLGRMNDAKRDVSIFTLTPCHYV